MRLARVRILNFDDSVVSQGELINRYKPAVIDLTGIGPACRLWVGGKAAAEIKKSLDPQWKEAVTFLGSGDFHHISSLLIEQFEEDFCVFIFDLHPDLDYLSPRRSCGAWVNLVAGRKAVKKTVILGASSEDLSFPGNLTCNFKWFKDSRVELYPFYRPPAWTLFKNLPENDFIHPDRRGIVQRVRWDNLRDKDIRQFILGLLKRLPRKRVYISVDKDCLLPEYALTNWEPGVLRLDWLLEALSSLRDEAEVIGMDITGEYSPVKTDSFLKKLCAHWDHPRQWAEEKSSAEIAKINAYANLKILELCAG